MNFLITTTFCTYIFDLNVLQRDCVYLLLYNKNRRAAFKRNNLGPVYTMAEEIENAPFFYG